MSKLAEPSVIATGFGGSSIDLTVRWFIDECNQANKVASIHEVMVAIKAALDSANINIPFPIRTPDFGDDSVDELVDKVAKRVSVNLPVQS